MANWLVTVNYSDFNLEQAYETLPKIYWKNKVEDLNKGLQINDIVYVYVTQPIAKVMYRFRVTDLVENSEYPIEQKFFWANKQRFQDYSGRYAIFEKLNKLDKNSLSRDFFIRESIISETDTLQGRRTDRDKSLNDPITLFFDYISNQFSTETKNYDYPDEGNLDVETFPEGAKKTVQVNRYERNSEARAKCIGIHGTRCKVCNMSFEETYGFFAKDFIHVHHKKSLKEISGAYEVNPETDLIPVCPNCHAMLHRQENGEAMKFERLKLLYEVSANSK